METAHKQIVLGILAHVDSGKTTLSEAMLYRSGAIRKLGRVDHKDAFLDTDTLEKARGITIFSKQALLTAGNTDITLLDTPGHVDFSTETERTLQVLDYAVLVVSGTDGVQSHTETLWRLLRRYHVPTFVFVNKMDLPGKSREELLTQLNRRLGEGFVDFGAVQADRDEALAVCDENLMERMLDAGRLTDADIIPAVARRHVFPCWFGHALRRSETDEMDSVDELLTGLDRFTRPAPALEAFGAKVFKITRDAQGARLTHMKITGGTLGTASFTMPNAAWGDFSTTIKGNGKVKITFQGEQRYFLDEVFVSDPGTTGIENVEMNNQPAVKGVYSIDGRYLGNDISKLGKGLYIVNGKKIVK